jgi:hypothetical protein
VKKVFWLVAILVVIGAVAMAGRSLASPEHKACAKLHDLCGGDADAKSLAECTDSLERTRKLAGDAGWNRSMACIDESSSCAAATGCLMGGVGVGAMGEFMKGFGSALSK